MLCSQQGQNKSETTHTVCAEVKRKEKKPGPNWIGAAIVSAEIVTVGKAT